MTKGQLARPQCVLCSKVLLYMTKSLGTRLKLICDGPELKTLCHYYFHINVIIQQKCFDILLQWSRCT